jgi:phosphatidylethanolamine/phosphatidyl-N-methylethanolamine N-methyltransferase
MSWTFFREFLKNCQNTGAIAPSSQKLAETMMKAARVGEARHVLELGPGTGAFTHEIEKTLAPGAAYLGLDVNPMFIATLRDRFSTLHFEQAEAQHFDYAPFLSNGGFDTIVSGLPWAALPESIQNALLEKIFSVLKPGGVFATFVYTGIHWMPRGQRFRRLLTHRFPNVELTPTVWGNLPPAFVYVASK